MRLAPTLLATGAALAACTFLACHSSQADSPVTAAPAPAAAAPAPASPIQGKVLEVLPASPYTYLRLQSAQGEVWAAVPAAEVKVGANVTVLVQIRMDKFQSNSLQRTFDSVYMGTLAGDAPVPAAPPAAPANTTTAVTSAHSTPPPAPGPEKVAKAKGAGAYTIAELYAKKNTLKDQTVTVRAKVTRCIGGILGRTWIHLYDGSGQAKTRDFDLAVTTKDMAKLGDVVTVKGILHLDKDFGSGYAYPVIIEDAKISH
jgi:hypothetical protein